MLVMGQAEKAITESEKCQYTKDFFHRNHYLSNSKFNTINLDVIEIAITPKPVLFLL